jgi:hypothetical protein
MNSSNSSSSGSSGSSSSSSSSSSNIIIVDSIFIVKRAQDQLTPAEGYIIS